MPKNKDFALRIEIIDECLRNRYRNWTLQNLVDGVNEKIGDRYGKSITRRTIQNDLSFLINEKEAPIEKRKSQACCAPVCEISMKLYAVVFWKPKACLSGLRLTLPQVGK